MTNKVAIVMDSAAYLSEEYRKQDNITVKPLSVYILKHKNNLRRAMPVSYFYVDKPGKRK